MRKITGQEESEDHLNLLFSTVKHRQICTIKYTRYTHNAHIHNQLQPLHRSIYASWHLT